MSDEEKEQAQEQTEVPAETQEAQPGMMARAAGNQKSDHDNNDQIGQDNRNINGMNLH